MESKAIYNLKLYVAVDKTAFIIDGDPELLKDLESRFLEDDNFEGAPKDPGTYQCRVEYFFDAGGGEEPEADWRYEFRTAVLMEPQALEARVRELEIRHEADTAKAEALDETNNRLQGSLATAKEGCKEVIDWFAELLKLRSDLPLGLSSEMAVKLRALNAVLRAPDGWDRYYSHDYIDHEIHSMQYDWRKLAKAAGMEVKDGEEVLPWHVAGYVAHLLEQRKEKTA